MKEKDLIKLIVNSVKKVVGKKTSSLHEPIFYGNEKKYLNKYQFYFSYVGKFVNLFEKKICNYTKSKHAVALINGTSAIHILLMAGVKPGDYVITQALTFVATANAIKY